MSHATVRLEPDVDDLRFILVKTAQLFSENDPSSADVRAYLLQLDTACRCLRDTAAADAFHMNPMLLGMEDKYQQQIAGVRVFVEVELAPHHHARLRSLSPDESLYPELLAIVEREDRLSAPTATEPSPPPSSTRRSDEVTTVEEGLSALQKTLDTPAVQEAVVGYEAHFRETRMQVDKLARYKALHDQIHTLQFSYFEFLENTVNRPSIDDNDLCSLAHYEVQIRQIVDDSRRIAQQGSFVGSEIDWIDELQSACDDLHAGVDAPDHARLRSAVRRMNRILATRPELINRGLIHVARDLPLRCLAQALAGVRGNLPPGEHGGGSHQQVKDSEVALADISRQLSSLVENHDAWQAIDVELRRLDGALEWNPPEFEFSWLDLKHRVERLCGDDTADWARTLRDAAVSVETSMSGPQSPRLKQAFAMFRRHVARRFWEVDFTLKALCEELRQLDVPLAQLLSTIAWRNRVVT
jgi:hypothetical protein